MVCVTENIFSRCYTKSVDNGIKKELFLPMTESICLDLEGFYKCNKRVRKFHGEIKIFKNKGYFDTTVFEGPHDPSILGFFYHEEDKTKLVFLKTSKEKTIPNLLYVVERQRTQNLCGAYLGTWYEIPFLYTNEKCYSFDTFIPEIGKLQQELVLLGRGIYGSNIYSQVNIKPII